MHSSAARHVSQPLTVAEYYRDEQVRARMLEYCGATPDHPATAAYVVALDPDRRPLPIWNGDAGHLPSVELPEAWHRGCDVSRSLWDAEHLVFLLELDYQNIDQPAEPFLRPAETFFKLEPAYRAASTVFTRLNLHTRAIATGRGYHFTGQIPLVDPLVDRLAALAPETPTWYAGVDTRRPVDVTTPMTERHARAATGLGLLIEHASHLVLARASGTSEMPVVVNGTIVGSGRVGRECVSIDFSHVGDPLDVRHLRIAFSTYQWHRLRPDIFGEVASAMPPIAALPRTFRSVATFLTHGRTLDCGVQMAGVGPACLPDVTAGIDRLLTSYAASPLAAWHRAFYAARRDVGTRLHDLDVSAWPPCVARGLQRPNDLLLKPEHLQHLVRGLMSRGWSPAEIAGLVQSKYEEDCGWGDRWSRMHPQTRAEFEVRVFAGLIATGADRLVDFNCVSAQEKDICSRTGCRYDLRTDRDHLMAGQPS